MAEENIVRRPGIPFDPVERDWEDDIVDAYRDAPRKAVWVPMDDNTRHWYMAQQPGVHDLVNSVLRSYIEAEIARQQAEDGQE